MISILLKIGRRNGKLWKKLKSYRHFDIEDLELEDKEEDKDDEKEVPDYSKYTIDKILIQSIWNFTHKDHMLLNCLMIGS